MFQQRNFDDSLLWGCTFVPNGLMISTVIGKYLRRARLEKGFTDVGEAATAIGITQGYLYKLEADEKKPSLDALEQIAKAYGVMVGDLLPTSQPKGSELAPILVPLFSLKAEQREMVLKQLGGVVRSFMAVVADYQVQAATSGPKEPLVVKVNTKETSEGFELGQWNGSERRKAK